MKVAGEEMDMEMIPGSITMKINDSEREGESFQLEWEKVEVSPLNPDQEEHTTDETVRYVASASRPGQSRRSPTWDQVAPG